MTHNTLAKKLFLLTVLALFAFVLSAKAEDAPGKKLFLDNKCNTCHSIDSQGIAKTMASSKAPDLSNVGSERNAEWISKYLMKEETLKDKKHMKAWAGTKEDLETLSKWLETLKTKK